VALRPDISVTVAPVDFAVLWKAAVLKDAGDNRTTYGEYRTAYGENRITYGEYHLAIWRKSFCYGENYLARSRRYGGNYSQGAVWW
jgi:hypothetical protein